METEADKVLNQKYMSADDLKKIMPTMGIDRCRKYIKEIQNEMEEKGYFIPKTTPRLALTKLIKKKFGF